MWLGIIFNRSLQSVIYLLGLIDSAGVQSADSAIDVAETLPCPRAACRYHVHVDEVSKGALRAHFPRKNST